MPGDVVVRLRLLAGLVKAVLGVIPLVKRNRQPLPPLLQILFLHRKLRSNQLSGPELPCPLLSKGPEAMSRALV